MKKVFEKIIAMVLAVGLVACAPRDSKQGFNYADIEKPSVFTFHAFDTECSISIYGVQDEEVIKALETDLSAVIDIYENTLSRTKEGSDIYEINHRTSDSVMITNMTAKIFEEAKILYEWSDGKFDISAGTLIELWDVQNRKTLPSLEEINEARSHCANFNYVVEKDVEPELLKGCRITFSGDKNTVYDVGALGKGYCCDSLRAALKSHEEIPAAIINLGGNVCCVGRLNGRKDGAFNIGIFKPFKGNEIIEKVKVVDKNVITSGNYQRYFTVDGDKRIYHHIIDPTTGYPTDNGLNSVTIVSDNGFYGDYLSTTCMLLGLENSKVLLDFCKEKNVFGDKKIQAIFVDENNNVTKYPENVKNY